MSGELKVSGTFFRIKVPDTFYYPTVFNATCERSLCFSMRKEGMFHGAAERMSELCSLPEGHGRGIGVLRLWEGPLPFEGRYRGVPRTCSEMSGLRATGRQELPNKAIKLMVNSRAKLTSARRLCHGARSASCGRAVDGEPDEERADIRHFEL